MRIIRLDSDLDKKKLLHKISATKEGVKIMQDKMTLDLFYIRGLRTPAANILKQDALSIGAELAVEKDTILCKDETVDAVLIVNEKQKKILTKKSKAQPFGLKKLASVLKEHRPKQHHNVEIMGVINANCDSFYSGSRFEGKSAILEIENMVEHGADIIDIGGVSSRPGSQPVSDEAELARVKPIIDEIYYNGLYKKVTFSLDSYAPLVIAYALQKGFHIINDITGLEDDTVCSLASEYNAQVVIMHMQKNPLVMQNQPYYEHVISDVEDFFEKRLEKAERFGIKDIILDVGIGFGKNLDHNLLLIKHMAHFLKFQKQLLIGASRKSMIDAICPTSPQERLPGTLALHLKAVEQGASIIRCHDVKEHYQALKVHQCLQDTLI